MDIASNGMLTIGQVTTGIPQVLSGCTINNAGTATWAANNTDDLLLANGAVFNNLAGAVFEVQNNKSISQGAGAASSFNNAGTFRKTQGIATTTIGCAYSNAGLLTIESGIVYISGPFANYSGTTLTNGDYAVAATLKFTNANIATNAANIILDGPASAIVNQNNQDGLANLSVNDASGSLTFANGRNFTRNGLFTNAGYLTVNAANSTFMATGGLDNQGTLAGVGTIAANVTNSGVVAPGVSPGTLTITGNYTQAASGMLVIEIGGHAPGVEFDRLDVSGTALLDGALDASLISTFVPNLGDSFTFLVAGSSSGTFITLNVPCLAAGSLMAPVYHTTSVELLVEPATSGDMDCNCAVDSSDVVPFVLALVDPTAYQVQYPNCSLTHADMNNDGLQDGADIQEFLNALLPP
ncbi:MAG: hypothetical protein L6Q92_16585 [Phycisphaerae bacterium]|nr:hypothetical protein [Phycisphaerae bacterium]